MANDTWSEYAKLVLEQLKTNTDAIKELGRNYHELLSKIQHMITKIQLDMVEKLNQMRRDQTAELDRKVREIEEDFSRSLNAMSDEFRKQLDAQRKEIENHGRQLTALNVKAGIFGFLGSFLAIALAFLMKLL